MKLEIRMVFHEDLERRLLKDISISNDFDIENAAYSWIDNGEDVVDRIIHTSKGTSGFGAYLNFELDRKELSVIDYFEVNAKKFLKITDKIQLENDEYMRQQPYVQTSEKTRIKLREKIYIGSINLKQDTIASMEFGEGYVCATALSSIFVDSNLSAYKEFPVYNSKTEEIDSGYILIGADNILPPLEQDPTIVLADNCSMNDICYRRIGLTSYPKKEMESFCDFNYTAESYGDDDNGLLVVSRKVKDLCKRRRIKGVNFNPILDRSAELYTNYINTYSEMSSKISINPNNKIR